MRLFESKTDHNTPADCKQKKIPMPLKVDMLNTKMRKIKNYEWKGTLKKLDLIYVI